MKKFICVALAVILIYLGAVLINKTTCKAEYTFDINGAVSGIKYGNNTYVKLSPLQDWYRFINDDISESSEKIYITSNNISDFLLPFEFFSFYSAEYDDYSNFIIEHTDNKTVTDIYVRDDFVLPSVNQTEINEVWPSLAASDKNKIKDIDTVNKIVKCAKSNGETELDKEIYDFLKETSWDNHCIYLKYKGYPLVEEFFIKETDDGRYIIDQFNAEEYDTIYLDDEAHK